MHESRLTKVFTAVREA